MDLHLDVVDRDGAAVRDPVVHLAEGDRGYPLPRLVLTARPERGWIEAVTVSCALDPSDEELRRTLLAQWESSGPAGHGTRLSSVQRWLPAELVHRPTEHVSSGR